MALIASISAGERLALVAQHVQHRAEHLAPEIGDRSISISVGATKVPRAQPRRAAPRATAKPRARMASTWARISSRASALMTGPTSAESRSGGPTSSSRHRRLDHLEHAVGDVLLQAQHAQGRTALAGRIEGRSERVGDHLLGQRRGIDDQRVLAAGLGDQRDRLAVGAQPAGERARRSAWRPRSSR